MYTNSIKYSNVTESNYRLCSAEQSHILWLSATFGPMGGRGEVRFLPITPHTLPNYDWLLPGGGQKQNGTLVQNARAGRRQTHRESQ